MALATIDFPSGTRIDAQGYHRDPDYVASYERDYDVRGGRIGRSRILAAFESLDVERTPARARSTFDLFATIFGGKQGAALLKVALLGEGIDPSNIAIGKIRRAAIGQGAIAIPLRVKARGIAFDFTITFMRFDRVLVDIGLVGVPGSKLVATDVDRVSRIAIERVRAGLLPAIVAPPIVSGVAQVGQGLTASRGAWTGDQLAFTHQWERCDASGGGCVPVAGATGRSYTVTPGDLTSTLRVSVTGRNRLGQLVSSGPPTVAITGVAGAPVNTVMPAISGSAQVGGSLNVTAGVWDGSPIAFAYQWRRCDGSGGTCSDIAGATAPVFSVTSTDSRSTLRVLVVATNTVGPGGALTAPTSAVP